MLRTLSVSVIVLVSSSPLFAQPPLPPKLNPPRPLAANTARARDALARKALAQPIAIPEEWKQPRPLKHTLDDIRSFLAEKKMSLPIRIDMPSFLAAQPEAPNLLETTVTFPEFFDRMPVEMALRIALSQFPASDAVMLVVDGRVEIVQEKAARNAARLAQSVSFAEKGVTLRDAAAELSARSGLSIVFDPRCDAALEKTIDVDVQPNTSVRGLLTAWADMHDLKFITDDHRVLLMPRAAYLQKLAEEAEVESLLGEIAKTRKLGNVK